MKKQNKKAPARKAKAPAVKFAEWMSGAGLGIAEVAEDLGIAGSTLYALRRGAFPPGLELAIKIEKYTQGEIEAISWVP